MGIRYLLVLLTVIGVCVVSPLRPIIGLYGYYWFAMMRPDILAWAGPNRYSLFIALSALLSNFPRILRNLPSLVVNSALRNLVLFFLVVTISVIAAVDPSLCTDRYVMFSRMLVMALVIPLIIENLTELKWFFVVVAGSLGLLGTKFGLWGLLRGGVVVSQGYGGMLSDNNTMALAFAMSVPICWFARLLVPWRWARLAFIGMSLCSVAAVVFTHSRGGVLSVAMAMLVIMLSERRKALTLGILAVGGLLIGFLVWDSLTKRMSTIENPMADASARNRIVMLQAAPKLWMDYPLFGVGFTESNQQRLLFKYVDPKYAANCIGLVLHNTWAQVLVDTGIFGFLLYMWLLVTTGLRSWRHARRTEREGRTDEAAILYAIACSLATFLVGATFLSRTGFDLFYALVCTYAAWVEVNRRAQSAHSLVAVAAPAELQGARNPVAAGAAPPSSARRLPSRAGRPESPAMSSMGRLSAKERGRAD